MFALDGVGLRAAPAAPRCPDPGEHRERPAVIKGEPRRRFLGLVSAHSQNDVNGTTQRGFSLFSQPASARFRVANVGDGAPPNCGGPGIPQRSIAIHARHLARRGPPVPCSRGTCPASLEIAGRVAHRTHRRDDRGLIAGHRIRITHFQPADFSPATFFRTRPGAGAPEGVARGANKDVCPAGSHEGPVPVGDF